MAKFKNVESDTLQGAFVAWLLAAVSIKDLGIGTVLTEAEIWTAILEERNSRLRECD